MDPSLCSCAVVVAGCSSSDNENNSLSATTMDVSETTTTTRTRATTTVLNEPQERQGPAAFATTTVTPSGSETEGVMNCGDVDHLDDDDDDDDHNETDTEDEAWWDIPEDGTTNDDERCHGHLGHGCPRRRRRRRWWHNIPKGAEAIVKGIAAERVLVDLLDNRLAAPKHVVPNTARATTTTTTTTTTAAHTTPTTATPNHNNNSCHNTGTTTPATAATKSSSGCFGGGGGTGVDFEAVYRLMETYPGLCHKTFEFQWDNDDTRYLTPLAILCCFPHTPVSLLQLVYDNYPAALQTREARKGCLPFHYACTFDASVEALDFLYRNYPPAIQTPRHDGMYPLHLAIYFKADLAIVKQLVKYWPQALKQCDFEHWNALHAAARGQASIAVVRYLDQALREQEQQQESATTPPNELAADTQLQQPQEGATANSASANAEGQNDAVPATTNATTTTVTSLQDYCAAVDDKGRTPLHLACRKPGNLAVIQYFVEQAPHTLWMEDGASSTTPLFAAARHQTVPVMDYLLNQATLAAVVAAREDAAAANNNDNNNNNVARMRRHNQPRPHHLFWVDHWGATLLHYAALENNAHNIEITTDNDKNQHGSDPPHNNNTTTANDGNNYNNNNDNTTTTEESRFLRWIRRTGQDRAGAGAGADQPPRPIMMVEYLCHRYPEWITRRTQGDGCRYLPLHLACRYHGPVENIQYLARQDPQTLLAKCHRGRTPYELAQLYYLKNHTTSTTTAAASATSSSLTQPQEEQRKFVLQFLMEQTQAMGGMVSPLPPSSSLHQQD
ncbi:hypothetical protein ACA910_012228 [Epithemia clementina (nom. ined.)]